MKVIKPTRVSEMQLPQDKEILDLLIAWLWKDERGHLMPD
jgi:hypothetical protein